MTIERVCFLCGTSRRFSIRGRSSGSHCQLGIHGQKISSALQFFLFNV